MQVGEATLLKIVQVLDTYDDARNGGVISTRRFTRLLRENSHTVTVVTTGKAETGKVLLKEFYPPVRKKTMQRMGFVFARAEKKILVKTFSGADIIHNQFPFLLGYHAVKIARNLKKPLVSSFHVQAEQIVFNAGSKSKLLVDFVYWLFVKFIYNRSEMVICPSEFAANEIRKHGCTKPTVVISNGVPSEYFPANPGKKINSKFTLLTVGRNAVEKRQEMILRAVANSKYKNEIRLIIIGNGPLKDHLKNLSKELLNDSVEFYFLPPQEVIPYYQNADLYVHAATVEVECMTALEAMACGLPLLIAEADMSATKQFALNDNHLFKTEKDLTEKINYWFENKAELLHSKEVYLKLVHTYRIEVSCQKLLETYHTVIKLKQGAERIRAENRS